MGIGNAPIRLPKTLVSSGSGIRVHSGLLPPYLRHTRSVEAMLLWLYLKCTSTGDLQEVLSALLSEDLSGLSVTTAATLTRHKQQWYAEYDNWNACNLSQHGYLNWWVVGVYFSLGSDGTYICLLRVIGVFPDGTKELVAIEGDIRKSEQSWYELLMRPLHEQRR